MKKVKVAYGGRLLSNSLSKVRNLVVTEAGGGDDLTENVHGERTGLRWRLVGLKNKTGNDAQLIAAESGLVGNVLAVGRGAKGNTVDLAAAGNTDVGVVSSAL